MKAAICISAYNEEANLGRLLTKLSALPYGIIVCASGCTDRTVEIAQSFPNVKTLIQERREGKASAINYMLSQCDADIIILESADTLPGHKALYYLLQRFDDPMIGMVGAHPIPTNSTKMLMGKIAHLIWEGHHQLALQHPKAGEVVAFRRSACLQIDPKTAVDEAFIEGEIVKRGYKVVYEPKAIIFNRGPETMSDFIKQRRRIYGGHKALKRSGYVVSTMSLKGILKATLKATKNPLTLLVGTLLEAYCRLTAGKQEQTVWEMACTTKALR